MARGTSLLKLREMLRAEIGAASSVAMGINTENQFDHLLRRTQEILWTEHDWEFAQIDRDEALIAGQRYYAFDDEVDFQRIISAHVKHDGKWKCVDYGIGVAEYNAKDSEIGEVSSPVDRWQHHESNQFEVWPVPDVAQSLRFRCYRKLPALIAPSDQALLDDNLIVLRCAAEYLSRTGSKDAQAKLAQATIHFNRLKGQATKIDGANFGGSVSPGPGLRWIGNRAVRETRF
jgi:hypothetical protein